MNGAKKAATFVFRWSLGVRPAVTCSGREGALTTKGTVIRGPPGNGQYSDQPASQLTPFSISAHKSGYCESPSGCLYVRRQVFRSGSDQPYRAIPSAHTPVSPSSLLHAPANKTTPSSCAHSQGSSGRDVSIRKSSIQGTILNLIHSVSISLLTVCLFSIYGMHSMSFRVESTHHG